MKKWTALMMALAICLSGFVSAAHAGTNPEHAEHDANRQHECHEQAAPQKAEKSDAKHSFCEAVCHVPLIIGSVMDSTAKLASTKSAFSSQANGLLSWLTAVPDQPPRLS